jgi:hypothetical protein
MIKTDKFKLHLVIKYLQKQINEICVDFKKESQQIDQNKNNISKFEAFKQSAEP